MHTVVVIIISHRATFISGKGALDQLNLLHEAANSFALCTSRSQVVR